MKTVKWTETEIEGHLRDKHGPSLVSRNTNLNQFHEDQQELSKRKNQEAAKKFRETVIQKMLKSEDKELNKVYGAKSIVFLVGQLTDF